MQKVDILSKLFASLCVILLFKLSVAICYESLSSAKAVIVLNIFLQAKTIDASRNCPLSTRTLHLVNNCPTTLDKKEEAASIKHCYALAKRQNCSNSSIFKYHCVTSQEENVFMEICAPEVYIYSGHCATFDKLTGKIVSNTNQTCSNATQPCPDKYKSSDLYLYSSCYGSSTPNVIIHRLNEGGKDMSLPIIVPLAIISVTSVVALMILLSCKLRRKIKQNKATREETEMKTMSITECRYRHVDGQSCTDLRESPLDERGSDIDCTAELLSDAGSLTDDFGEHPLHERGNDIGTFDETSPKEENGTVELSTVENKSRFIHEESADTFREENMPNGEDKYKNTFREDNMPCGEDKNKSTFVSPDNTKKPKKELPKVIAEVHEVPKTYKNMRLLPFLKQTGTICIPNVSNINHIGNVTGRSIWVSDRKHVMEIDFTNDILNHFEIDDIRGSGSHTGTNEDCVLFIQDNEIKSFSNNKQRVVFSTPWECLSICTSKTNGDIILGMYILSEKQSRTRVVRYNKKGKMISYFEKYNEERLYISPLYLSENLDGSICTSDIDTRLVKAVDKSGKLHFTFAGCPEESAFIPTGICNDEFGNVIVCNRNANSPSVYLLDKDGIFISKLLSLGDGLKDPWGLCVDENGQLFIGQHNCNTVMIFKYLNL